MGNRLLEREVNEVNKKTILKRLFALVLVFVTVLNCVTVSSAKGRVIETAGSGDFSKTFENTSKGGTLYIKDLDGNVLKELKNGDKVTYQYPDGESPAEVYIEAKAEEGYVVKDYKAMQLLDKQELDTCESLYNIHEKTYKRGHFLATAEFDELFSVSFVKETDMEKEEFGEMISLFAVSSTNIDDPKKGDKYTGKATLTYNGRKTELYNGTGYITCTSGDFKGDQITLQTCASGHDYWAPQTGQTGTYTITITNVNKDTGKITCTVTWANDKHTEGYQNLSGTFSYEHSFSGELRVTKENGEPEGSFVMTSSFKFNMDMSATFEVYTDEKCTKKVGTLKTGRTGESSGVGFMSPGTYYVKETIPPEGFALNPTVFKVKVGSGSSKAVSVKDNVLRARISGVKIDSLTGKPVPTTGLSLAGAEYKAYEDEACTKECNKGVSDSNGNIEFEKEYFAYGTYYIKETKAPEGYNPDLTVHKVVVDESLGYYEGSTYRLNDASFTSVEDSQRGKGKVIKTSEDKSITDGNCSYSLAGCKFQLTSVRTGEVMPEILVTNELGITQEAYFPVGTYKVKEIEAPKGFELSSEEKTILIREGNKPAEVVFSDKALNDPAGVRLKKVDAETGTEIPTGAGELAGAEYTFRYYDGQYTTAEQLAGVVPTRTWVFATDEKGVISFNTSKKVSGDDFYTNSDGSTCIPLGTLTIQETKAPEGYLLDKTLHIQNITADFQGVIIESGQISVSKEQTIRGDLKGIKVSAGDMKRLVGVPFKITSVDNGENHVVITDKNGAFDTSSSFNLHSQNTNRGETSSDGVWFGDIKALDDERGALPYGSYLVEELPCEANKDRILIEPFEVCVTRDSVTVDLGMLINESVPVPEIGTKATDKYTGLQVTHASKTTTIVDEVEYTNVTKGKEYTVKGILMDRKTGKPLLIDGKEVTAETTFTAKKAYGTVSLEFSFDSSALKGKSVVAFEHLYHKGKEVATHADIKDKGQTVRILDPVLQTSAVHKETGKKTAYVDEKTTITDKVTYQNLIAGAEYTVKGILMDRKTEKPLLIDGKEVTAEKTFIAEKSNGYVNLDFTFDSSALKGKKTVVFERVYYGEEEIASHTDIKDKNQTVKFKAPPEEEPPKTKTPGTPKTGDNVPVFGAVVLLILSLCGAFILLKKNRKGRKKS